MSNPGMGTETATSRRDLPHAVAGFDLRALDRGFLDNPYPVYRLLREHDPVRQMPDGSWFLTRYDDLQAVYRDNKKFSSDKKIEFAPKYGADTPLYRHHTTSLVFNDPPLHTRVRRLLAPAFTPRALKLLEGRFMLLVERMLDRAAKQGGMDVIADFASALPVEIIGDMLAVPHEDRHLLRDWSLAILGALEPVLTPERAEQGNRATVEFETYLEKHIAAWSSKTGEDGYGDVLGALIAGEAGGERLSAAELVQNCIFLLNAGHETTTNLIGNGIAALLDWPDQKQRLIAEPGLIRTAIEEFLRFESSNQLGNRRVVEEAGIGGVMFAPGALVTLCIGAANRDPDQFPDPDRLDIGRNPNRHLAFGAGIHACAGMSLARLEGQIAIGRLLARFPAFRSSGQAVRGGRARFRGYLSFPIEF
ncbi:MAG: cytochrome P450 [Ferrovibrio sp.]|uniref:cytochrome P450 n=1 Tax=Ferrovibrio sp. TaxID=1917215 RepID=UPI002624E3A6|nr:cytochrome P450 [Ferrovibrio sp.]MCW0232176.1 cytochrome P450 [Ferrovibrio sp.]